MHILGETLNEIFTAADENIEAYSCRYLAHFGKDIFWNAHTSEYSVCVDLQISADLIYTTVEAWNHLGYFPFDTYMW
jgi:hypothetical protein